MNKVIKILLFILVLIILIIVLLLNRNTFASFISKINGTSTTKIAEPIFIMKNTEKKILNDDNTEVDYYFNIKNFNSNNERTQVDLKYYIEIQANVDESIIFTLYKDDAVVTLDNKKTDYIDLEQDSNITHNYRLNVKYDREKSNSTTDIKENIFIKVNAIQG